jgi:predicted small secreted protein
MPPSQPRKYTNANIQRRQFSNQFLLQSINTNQNKNMPISDVSEQGSWIVVYDDNNKEIKRMGSSNKEVVAVTSDFFVVLTGSWIVTYDEKCKEINRMGSSNKSVKGASGRTFTVIQGSWIITYDQNCKEKGRRGR